MTLRSMASMLVLLAAPVTGLQAPGALRMQTPVASASRGAALAMQGGDDGPSGTRGPARRRPRCGADGGTDTFGHNQQQVCGECCCAVHLANALAPTGHDRSDG